MIRTIFLILGICLLGLPVNAQEQPKKNGKRYAFNFKNVPLHTFLEYIKKVTGKTIINQAKADGTVSALEDTKGKEFILTEHVAEALQYRPKFQE